MMASKKRILVRFILILLAAWLALIAWGFAFAWRPLEVYLPNSQWAPLNPVLDDSQYRLGHEEPFLVEAHAFSGSGAVLIYGSRHTNDPDDPALRNIESSFHEFQPTVVLCEGRMTGLLFPGMMDPVKTYGEPGLVRQLAYANGCEVYTWEPPPAVVVSGLLEQGFEREQIALRLILASYFSNLRFGKPDHPDSFVEEAIGKKRLWPEIGNAFANVEDLDKSWHKQFPNGPDWRDVSDEQTLPGFLGVMDSNIVRDTHLFQIVCELVMRRGERVFVIAGSSHAVKLESAIKSTIR